VEASLERLARVRAASAEVGRPIGALVDLPGPKVRAAAFPEDGVELVPGTTLRLTEAVDGDRSSGEVIAIAQPGAVDSLVSGDRVALGDGGVSLLVVDRDGDAVHAVVASGGVVRGRPGVSLPEDRLDLRSPTEHDLQMLERVLEAGV